MSAYYTSLKQAIYLSRSILFGLCIYVVFSVNACQGLDDRVPSTSFFEVQSLDEQSDINTINSKNLDGHAGQNSISENTDLLIPFQIQSHLQNTRDEAQTLLCQIDEATLAHSLHKIKSTITMSVVRVQSQLWLETELEPNLKDILIAHKSSLPTYTPLEDHGGLWVLYTALNGEVQSLFLAKPVPWMCERAKVLAHCSPSELLTQLSFTPLNINKNVESKHNLKLVSKDFQVHSISD